LIDRLIWQPDRMILDDLVFRIEHNLSDDWELGADCFRFFKVKGLVDAYASAFACLVEFQPKNVFELGIWDGGSIAFWFEWFKPDKHVAIDFSRGEDSAYFRKYIESRGINERIKTFWETNQADASRICDITDAEFDGPLDLVIDDCSHLYGPTKTSFEALFPYLRTGGLYVIEDWNWSYIKEFQSQDCRWAYEKPLAELVFELLGATGSSNPLIQNIIVYQNFVIVVKGSIPSESGEFRLDTFVSSPGKISKARHLLHRLRSIKRKFY
jgi:hypothetical protein